MNHEEYDDLLNDLLCEFEGALRKHLKSSEEFQILLDYLSQKHGSIALYVAAQVMGQPVQIKKRPRRKAHKKAAPLSCDLTRDDVEFLRSLKISADI